MLLFAILYSALVAIFALLEADVDAAMIKYGEEIDHAKGLKRRVVYAGTIPLLWAVWLAWAAWGSWWDMQFVLFPFMITYGTFGPLFRYRLNMNRHLPADYISSSNNYDRFFLSIFGWRGGWVAYATEIKSLVAGLVLAMLY